MAPRSKGKPFPSGFQSKSTSDLAAVSSLESRADTLTTATSGLRPANAPPGSAQPKAGDAEEEDDTFASEESEASEPEQEEDLALPTPRTLHTSRSHSHLPRHTANALYPPFYNRPPMPLPASPSLTSLLRPPFASRRTTPDSSDAELSANLRIPHNGASTAASSTTNLVNSAKHAPAVPRAAPKVPTYEYYGFALYLGSSAAFLGYILWAYVPAPMLHQMGIYYYPNRWWALAIPCWLIMLIFYIYFALASYNTGYLTLPLNSIENLVDETAQVAVVDRKTGKIVRDPLSVTDKLHDKDKEKGSRAIGGDGRRSSFSSYQFSPSDHVDWKELWSVGTDAVMDVPIGGVCEILYADES